jgi:MoxR-like ATPase
MTYFLTKVLKKGKEKVVALEGQGLDASLNIACPTKTRKAASEGTIFYAYGISTVTMHTGTSYYKVNYMYVLDSSSPKSVRDEYAKYLEKIGKSVKKDAEEVKEKEEVKVEEKPEKVEATTPTLFDEISKDKSLAAPKAKEGFYVSDEDWRVLVRNIRNHVNTMIVGPTGCGKTSVVQEICKRMGKKLHIFDMGTMVDPISSLLGVHRLEKGASVFDYAKFTQVIKEPCVILLDELSRSPLTTMNILFSCLDDRRNLNIEIACGSGEREIDVHPEVTFIATANVGSEYSGANTMDRALVNRFFLLELGCIPAKEESGVLVARTGITPETANLIVKIANNIRSLCAKQEISVSLSIRETLMVAKLASDGWPLAKAMEMIYLPLYEGSKNDGERSTVYKTISSY